MHGIAVEKIMPSNKVMTALDELKVEVLDLIGKCEPAGCSLYVAAFYNYGGRV